MASIGNALAGKTPHEFSHVPYSIPYKQRVEQQAHEESEEKARIVKPYSGPKITIKDPGDKMESGFGMKDEATAEESERSKT